jgi:GTP-binding protein LepA
MVFAGIYPVEGEDYGDLREALEKLQLERRRAPVRAGNLAGAQLWLPLRLPGPVPYGNHPGALEREYDLDIVVTAPSVEYEVVKARPVKSLRIDSPAQLPDEGMIAEIREPWMHLEIFSPTDYYGTIMDLVTKRRGIFKVRNTRLPAACS